MNHISLLGYFATAVTVLAFLPQVIKAWKTKQTKDISLSTYMLLITAAIAWFSYGYLVIDTPLMVTNGSLFFLQMMIVFLKFKYG